ncbi:MAG TPA: hypothetical protein DIT28_16855 [Oxalobacteraceae bacterium]|jgi:hypothetical protein|nr:hypothetical protein [Oxalobacteraceae bacterium]HCN90819.1 hypothetical protein [Oxalobacteraceae bacterium]
MTDVKKMDDQMEQKGDTWTFPEPCPSRPDLKSAKVVETGISLQDMIGTAAAAVFLKSESIAVDVAARVLSQPTKRRKMSRQF